MTCDRCGRAVVGLEHGVGLCPLEPQRLVRQRAIAGDVTWPGGKTFDNLGPQPQTFYSPAELSRYCKAHNLEPMVRHQPIPGTDRSPHTTSWSAVSQETLDGAKAMLERVGSASATGRETWIESMRVDVTEEVGTVRAPRGTFGVFG